MSIIRSAFRLTCAVALFVSCFAPSAHADTTIKLTYVLETQRIAPNPTSGPAFAPSSLTIVLSGSNHVEEMYEGGGKHVLSANRSDTLGQPSADQSVRYHVIDANTIERVRDVGTYVMTFTIFVEGKSCRMTMQAALKPGQTTFENFSQELGVMATYKYFKLARSTCEISG